MARIYISSTYGDLKECRESVYHAIRTLGHDVVAMEDYVATDRRPADKCLGDVETCDLYVGIFAWRYGYVPEKENPELKSITELEFRHAVANEIPCLLFLLDENASWPYPQIEQGEGADKLKLLREELGKDYTVSFFSNCEQLAARVTAAVARWGEAQIGAKTSSAWEESSGPKKVSTGRLPVTGSDLFGRDEHLKCLDEAWADRDTHVLSFVAWGGVGKSALVNKWLAQMARDDYRGAESVYGWSFYSQGTTDRAVSADQFIEAALVFFGDTDPNRGSPWDKGERLAHLVGRRRTLLVLDGLEPLQFPPGSDEGRLKEQSMQALLRGLAAYNEGLCVISTRVRVTDLSDYEDSTVTRVELENLSDEAGAQVLVAQGAKGTQAELEQASREFGGHSLALTLLGSYLSDVCGGDIKRRTEVRGLEEDERYGRHAQRVMTSYERWFGEGPELSVLRILGLFNRPAEKGSIDALRAAPAIPGLTDTLQGISEQTWQRTLSKLRRARLLAERDAAEPDTLDAHPLVREHFELQLKRTNPDAWREGNSRLYEHLRDTTKYFPDTIEEMTRLYAAVAYGCAAGRHQETLTDVYDKRISRGSEGFSAHVLGAYGADLAAFTNFFIRPWDQLIEDIGEVSKGNLLNATGFILQALGRLEEANQPILAGLKADISQRNWLGAAVNAANLRENYLFIGKLRQALSYAEQSVELAERSGDRFQLKTNKARLADSLHQFGRLIEAELTFKEAELIQKQFQPQFPLLASLSGYHYCDLLLSLGRYREVIARAKETIKWSTALYAIALDNLSLGWAYLLQAQQENVSYISHASVHLERAVNGLRFAGTIIFLPLSLLAQSRLYLITNAIEPMQANLNEAMNIATRNSMGLFRADCHLEYARFYLAQDERDKSREHLIIAKEMIDRMGYHRRDEAVREIEAELEAAGR